MKKSELYKTVRSQVEETLVKGQAPKAVTKSILDIIDTYLEPKKGGAQVDLETVVKRDKDGNITHIQDTASKVFLPATVENFYEAKNGGIEVNGVALKRQSRLAEKIRKEFEKTIKASEKSIMQDVLEGVIKPEEGKAKMEEIKAQVPDYSSILEVKGAIAK